MRTTIDLPDALFKEAKATAALRGQSLKQIVVKALQVELRHGRSASSNSQPPLNQAFPTLSCKGDFVIDPTPEQLDDWV